ncbi:hypothetical protein tb265_03070 [Gemmatimonadetes bacterium T265]|nr:hypothetical protein tb265_03070 [Gemmatimonadetes bacterium T265]
MAGRGSMGGRWRRTVAAGVAFGSAAASTQAASAQAFGAARVPRLARPQDARPQTARTRAVALRLRPRAGDTVRTRFEQTVRYARRDAPTPEAVTPASAMLVIARSIVERVDATGAELLALTDSVAFSAAGAPPAVVERMRRGMQGRRAQLHVAPDGALAATGGPLGVTATLRLPGTLPTTVVAPGATWHRAMAVPSWGPAATPPHLDVAFRFDSVAADGGRAYISLRGRVHDDATGADDVASDAPAGGAGQVDGALVVDLVRGWVVESWATFRLDGMMVSAPGAAPAPVRVVVTQHLRAY